MSNILKNMEKCEENTLKCDEDVSKSMKTGEEKRIVREMRPEDVPSVALLEAECFSEPWSEQAFSDALKQRDPIYHKFADIEVVTGVKPFEELIKEIEGQLP